VNKALPKLFFIERDSFPYNRVDSIFKAPQEISWSRSKALDPCGKDNFLSILMTSLKISKTGKYCALTMFLSKLTLYNPILAVIGINKYN
jgi:hypothetical protein